MTGARCVVTGATGYLGTAVCAELVSRGARVGFTYAHDEPAARALRERLGGAPAQRLDLTRAAQLGPALDALVDGLGGVDAFVHVAGLTSTCDPPRFEPLSDMDEAGWDRLMAVNVKAPAFACQRLAPRFGEGGGNVVLIGSINGVTPAPSPVAYASSKAALSGMAQALAKELGPRCIRVNVVAPGLLEGGASCTVPAALREDYVKHDALGRFGRAEEVARVVGFFALHNTYVTGRTVMVDGGL